ncbi:hypothetical protein EPN29_04215 [bacterium]|nr:MAG: hypothetical protein EPN29_04215 [bacterium]
MRGRAWRQWDPLRVASAGLGSAVALMLAAYAAGATTSNPTPGGVVSAIALLAIAGSGLLYAWRLGTGGLVE